METVVINDTKIPVRAYLHRTSDTCVTAAYDGQGASTYENPRKLVAWEDVVDQADWLEHGIAEWRDEAIRARDISRSLKMALEKILSVGGLPECEIHQARAALAEATLLEGFIRESSI